MPLKEEGSGSGILATDSLFLHLLVCLVCLLRLQSSKGYTFTSDTDTEVIPKLCQYVYNSYSTKVPLSEVGGLWWVGGWTGGRLGGRAAGRAGGWTLGASCLSAIQQPAAVAASHCPAPHLPAAHAGITT